MPGGRFLVVRVGLPPDAPEAERRRKLAEWMTHPSNPLFARVIVNRLWHHHFGTGIVETPNDFGFNGGRPSHPELLDWLAAELIARGFHLKEIHRLIVTSSTYRQASAPSARGLAVDADDRLLWRKKPWRVEGEVLRDAMLAVAGLLNTQMGGPCFSDYRETNGKGTAYFDPIDPVRPAVPSPEHLPIHPARRQSGPARHVRLPRPLRRRARRNSTTTPLQALALWNDAFSLRMAEALAQPGPRGVPRPRIPHRLDRQIVRVYRARPPACSANPEELASAQTARLGSWPANRSVGRCSTPTNS